MILSISGELASDRRFMSDSGPTGAPQARSPAYSRYRSICWLGQWLDHDRTLEFEFKIKRACSRRRGSTTTAELDSAMPPTKGLIAATQASTLFGAHFIKFIQQQK